MRHGFCQLKLLKSFLFENQNEYIPKQAYVYSTPDKICNQSAMIVMIGWVGIAAAAGKQNKKINGAQSTCPTITSVVLKLKREKDGLKVWALGLRRLTD